MSHLLPCPFCGGAPFLHENDWCEPSEWLVQCECGAIKGGRDHTREAAIAAWNTRASGWQPIETAPKDGTRILVLDQLRQPHLVRWICAPHNRWSIDGVYHVHKPTCWQPTPKPPEAP